jgi:hypothetical protein
MGGNAGHSADITVMVKEDDMDLLSLLGTTSNSAPPGGKMGDFGLGGAGGAGGIGGNSCTFYSGERLVTNPGGNNGPCGVAGSNGKHTLLNCLCVCVFACLLFNTRLSGVVALNVLSLCFRCVYYGLFLQSPSS